MEEEAINITQIIIDTINTIFTNIFSSIDNNLYAILDDITFINTDILETNYFKEIIRNINNKWNFNYSKFSSNWIFVILLYKATAI